MSAERVEALAEVLFHVMYEPEDFTRGLREALAEVWDEGHLGLCRRHGVVPFTACRNPYREEQS